MTIVIDYAVLVGVGVALFLTMSYLTIDSMIKRHMENLKRKIMEEER